MATRREEREKVLGAALDVIGLAEPVQPIYVGNDGVWPRQGVCEGGH
jgi:hypothetical protein